MVSRRELTKRIDESSGQAAIEMLAVIPVLVLVALVVVGLMTVGQGRLQADAAAEAAAFALATDRDPEAAAKNVLPVSVRSGARFQTDGGRVTVDVPVVTPLSIVGVETRLTSTAVARLPDGTGGP